MFDPAKLLRTDWGGKNGANELAKELYVMLSAAQGAASPFPKPAPRLPLAPGRLPAGQPFGEEAALIRQRQPAPAVQATILPPSPARSQQIAQELRKQFPTDAGQAVAHAVPPLPPSESQLLRQDSNAQGFSLSAPVAAPAFPQQATIPFVEQEVRAASHISLALQERERGAAEAVLQAKAQRDESQPVKSPDMRMVNRPPSGPPGQPFAVHSSPIPARPPLTGLASVPVGRQPTDFGPGLVPNFSIMTTPLVTDPALAKKAAQDQVESDPPVPISYQPGELLVVYLDQFGMHGSKIMNPSSTAPVFVPGFGSATLYGLDLSNQQLIQQSGETVKIWNSSQLPVSGSQLVLVRNIDGFLWAIPPDRCHGIISKASAPCTSTTPDKTGTVTTYYMSAGIMTPDQTIPLESWFNVTAASGKHCTVFVIDGLISLEVLDC